MSRCTSALDSGSPGSDAAQRRADRCFLMLTYPRDGFPQGPTIWKALRGTSAAAQMWSDAPRSTGDPGRTPGRYQLRQGHPARTAATGPRLVRARARARSRRLPAANDLLTPADLNQALGTAAKNERAGVCERARQRLRYRPKGT
jgi:hypothetical protein